MTTTAPAKALTEFSSQFAGHEWVEGHLKRELSPFARLVCDILGHVFRATYNMPRGWANRVDWDNPNWIEVCVPESLGTFDNSELTQLVLFAHYCAIRIEINQGGPRRLKLCFSPREFGGDRYYNQHPTLQEAIARFEKGIGLRP